MRQELSPKTTDISTVQEVPRLGLTARLPKWGHPEPAAFSHFEIRNRLLLAARYFTIYIYATMILAILGPFDYQVLNPLNVTLYMTFILICFLAGYRFSVRRISPSKPLIHVRLRAWILIGLTVGLGTGVYSTLYEGPHESLKASLVDPGLAYQQSIAFMNTTSVSLVLQISTITYGLTMCAITAVFLNRDKFPKWVTWLAIACVVARIAYSLKGGTFKGIGDWLLFALTLYQLVPYRAFTKRHALYFALALVIYFGAHMYVLDSRKQAYHLQDGYSYLNKTSFRNDNIVARALGPTIYEMICSPIFYVTNGYAGLSASLDQEFVWTYGLGNSIALQTYATQYFSADNIMPRSYMVRAEAATGWKALMYWSTIFPWLASDITFPGCGLLFLLLGILYPRVLYRALYARCPLSAALLFYLNILLIFVPCNNQLMQTRAQMLGFLGTVLAYSLAVGARGVRLQ